MEDLVELLEFVNNNIRDLINKFSKLSKNNLTIKQMLLIEIIGNIMIINEKVSLEGDLLITLKFESFDQKAEFNKQMIRAGLPRSRPNPFGWLVMFQS